MSRTVNVTFWHIVDGNEAPFRRPVPWETWLQHINGLAVADRVVNVGGRQRLGKTWANGPQADPEMVVLSADRAVNPSQNNYQTGAISTASPSPNTTFGERISGIFYERNVLACVGLGTGAPRPSSLMSYLVDVCDLSDADDQPKVRLLPIARPDLRDEVGRKGRLVTNIDAEVTVAGMRALAGGSKSFLGMNWTGKGTDAPQGAVRYGIRAQVDTRARKRDTMDADHRAAATRLHEAARKLLAQRTGVTDGTITLLDEDDKRLIVSLSEENLTTQSAVPQNSSAVGDEDVSAAIRSAHDTWRQYLAEVLPELDDGVESV
jgi:hypothetical protein